jgi:hypothetical protein
MTFWTNKNLTNTVNTAGFGPIPYAGASSGGGAIGTGNIMPSYTTAAINGISISQPPNVMSIRAPNGKDIVTVENDGTITWADTINIDEAAEAFGQVLTLSVEMRSGITSAVKSRIRDSVFEDLISIAQDKGSLTAEDLTYLLRSSKIIENLKGI